MCDLFLVLAQTDEGVGCFAVPRILPDGTRNPFFLQRLKDKLGNKSNASSEVEFDGTWGRLVGEPGRGVRTIIEMVGHTRLDCTIGSAAGMRMAVAQAIHHARHRSAFGRTLVEQPLMANVLADLGAGERGRDRAGDAPRARLRRGGPGDAPTRHRGGQVPRLQALPGRGLRGAGVPGRQRLRRGLRDAADLPRGAAELVWEGSGNVNALDVLRTLAKEPGAFDVFWAELDAARGADARYDAWVARLRGAFADPESIELRGAPAVEDMAVAWQAALLVRHAPHHVADAFCAARLGGDRGLNYGTLPAATDLGAIIDRALPA
jgi:putative acyl-CoA dehydrogenase